MEEVIGEGDKCYRKIGIEGYGRYNVCLIIVGY